VSLLCRAARPRRLVSAEHGGGHAARELGITSRTLRNWKAAPAVLGGRQPKRPARQFRERAQWTQVLARPR
jgi:hypothetical protein